MKTFKRLLIGLDLTDTDTALLQYAAAWCKHYAPESVYFLNVQRSLKLPKGASSTEPLDEQLRHQMAKTINDNFPDFKQYQYEFDVIEGNPRDKISHWSKVKKVDLVMVGVKEEQKGRGILPQQVLRNVKCSMLFVPEHAKFSLKNICVPVKLADSSDSHLQTAIEMIEENGKLFVSHFYSIPPSYHMIGPSGMLMETIKEESDAELDELISTLDTGDKNFEIVKVLDSVVDYTLSSAIEKNYHKYDCDLAIMFAGKKSKIETFLIGSETEGMVKRNKNLTLLIFKE